MVVIASKPGQLGNRLLVFAAFIGSAMEHNFTFMNPAFDEFADYFQTTSRDLFCRYPAHRSFLPGHRLSRKMLYAFFYYLTQALVKSGLQLPRVKVIWIDWHEELDLSSPAFLENLRRNRLVLMQGWAFRDDANMQKHSQAIREFFRPLETHEGHVKAVIRQARQSSDVLVGVHIRHGDYRTFKEGKFFYELDEYANVMESVKKLFPGKEVSFLICSNADHAAESFARFRHMYGSNHFVEDMYALARCDYILGPPSTYTLWASFYGKVPLYSIVDPQRTPTLGDFIMYGMSRVDEAVLEDGTGGSSTEAVLAASSSQVESANEK